MPEVHTPHLIREVRREALALWVIVWVGKARLSPSPSPHSFPLNTLFACSAFAHQKPDYQIEEISSISRMYVMLSVSWSISEFRDGPNKERPYGQAILCFIPRTKLLS